MRPSIDRPGWQDDQRAATRDTYRALWRAASMAELMDRKEGLVWAALNPDVDPESKAVLNIMIATELEIIDREIQIRAANPIQPATTHSAAISRLRDEIHQRVPITEVLERELGIAVLYGPRPTEAHSACPACGGHDRFILWTEPKQRGYCRRCGYATDTIGLACQVWGVPFVVGVQRLATDYLGLGGAT